MDGKFYSLNGYLDLFWIVGAVINDLNPGAVLPDYQFGIIHKFADPTLMDPSLHHPSIVRCKPTGL